MRRPIFTKPLRERAARLFLGQIKEIFAAPPVAAETIAIVSTRHGLMRISASASPGMFHVYRQFLSAVSADDLPIGPELNPFSYKWNDWACPHHAPTPVEAIECFLIRLAEQHKGIV